MNSIPIPTYHSFKGYYPDEEPAINDDPIETDDKDYDEEET